MSLTPKPHTMSCGQSLTLLLAAGAELRCTSGQLLIQTSPVRGVEAASGGLSFALHTGHSWRAPQQIQLQAIAIHGPACLLHQPALPVVTEVDAIAVTALWHSRLQYLLRLLPRWRSATQPK